MGEITYITIKQKDGYITKLSQYYCSVTPKSSILILHGMAEHQKRYQSFAEFLVNQGFDVYCYDHRGHGTDKKLSDLGYFGPDNGYLLVVNDAITVSEHIAQHNRCNKLFLIGHSMGSLISRNIIQSYDKYNGVILSGTANPPYLLSVSGLFLSALISRFKGQKHVSPFLNSLLFGNNKYTSLCTRTAFDWLTRCNPIVGAYMNDPYCGFICTSSFYHDLIKLTKHASEKKLIHRSRKDLPIYLLSGEKDPVGGYGREVQKYAATLKKCGFTNISMKLYVDFRHEILNEIDKERVYTDILGWIHEIIDTK
ncbi:MAG: alpha/beta fold hydrolase [Herbinix sp.]|nr:alpha/beta fold hydrolase [Herbinix sp.]